jgi:short-subunit dehydrogenase
MRKVVVITGASSGLGKEVAKIYQKKEDYKLILCGRNEKGLAEFKNLPDIELILGDITKEETLEAIEKKVKENANRVDILINNAGLIYIKPFETNTTEELDSLLNTDLKAPMLLTQRLYPIMVTQGSGHIININSTAGKEGKANHTMYCAAKWGLTGFTNALRLEAKKHNIKVTSFHPGGMNTAFYDEMDGNVPVEKYMDPKKIAEILVQLSETDTTIAPDEIVINRMTK